MYPTLDLHTEWTNHVYQGYAKYVYDLYHRLTLLWILPQDNAERKTDFLLRYLSVNISYNGRRARHSSKRYTRKRDLASSNRYLRRFLVETSSVGSRCRRLFVRHNSINIYQFFIVTYPGRRIYNCMLWVWYFGSNMTFPRPKMALTTAWKCWNTFTGGRHFDFVIDQILGLLTALHCTIFTMH